MAQCNLLAPRIRDLKSNKHFILKKLFDMVVSYNDPHRV